MLNSGQYLRLSVCCGFRFDLTVASFEATTVKIVPGPSPPRHAMPIGDRLLHPLGRRSSIYHFFTYAANFFDGRCPIYTVEYTKSSRTLLRITAFLYLAPFALSNGITESLNARDTLVDRVVILLSHTNIPRIERDTKSDTLSKTSTFSQKWNWLFQSSS